MEAWVAQANEAGQVQAFRVPPQPIGQLQNGWSMQKTVDFTLLLLWQGFPSPSNCQC